MNAKEISLSFIEMNKIYDEAYKRYQMGLETYGVFNPHTDTRDLCKEAEDELLDFMNYAGLMIIKIRALKKALNHDG